MSPEEDGILRDVIEHLTFHKALIDDHSSEDYISKYIQMAKEIEKGVFIPADPFEKAISLVFELVMKEKMDPWDIDLARFAKLYEERILQSGRIDFVISGRIIYLAWSILKMQSGRALDDMKYMVTPPPETPQTEIIAEDDSSIGWDDPFSDEVGCEIIPDLSSSIRREPPSRPITLIDLVEAFNDAKNEVMMREVIARNREIDRKDLPSFQKKVHSEDVEQEICMVWQRILSFNGDPVPLRRIYKKERTDFVTVFISVLFLTKLRRIDLWQEGIPDGEIFIKNISGHTPLVVVKGELERSVAKDVLRCIAS